MDKWTYLLVYNEAVGTRDEVKSFLNSRPEILNWYYCLPNTFFVVSNKTATGLQQVMREFTKDKGWFLILDTNADCDGWMPRKAWDFVKTPKANWES